MKLTLVFSDIEAGTGNATDDFVEDELLVDTIRTHFPESKNHPADIVFNGDTLDYMKAPYKGKYPKHITEKISVYKTKQIYKAHKKYFKVLYDWIHYDSSNRVIFVVGNHDYDLVFPGVQKKLRDYIAGKDPAARKRVVFPGFEFYDGLVLVEHGSQLDQFFYVDPDNFVFTPKKDTGHAEPFLMLPWGYNALYDQFIYVKEKYPVLERIIPRGPLFGQLPRHLKKVFVVDTFTYMMKSFFYTQYKFWGDPVQRFTFKDFRKYLRNFFSTEWEVKFIDEAKKKAKRDKKVKVMVIGHDHKINVFKQGDKILLNPGCWRDEYNVAKNFQLFPPKNKGYAYILHSKDSIKMAEVIEVASRQSPLTLSDIKDEIAKGDVLFKKRTNKETKQARKIARKEHRETKRALRKEKSKKRKEAKVKKKKARKIKRANKKN